MENGCFDPARHAAEHISCTVALFDAVTGETAAFPLCLYADDRGEPDTGMWTRGNYSHVMIFGDLNRSGMFDEAAGHLPEDDEELKAGDDITIEPEENEELVDGPRYFARITRTDSDAIVLDEIAQLTQAGN